MHLPEFHFDRYLDMPKLLDGRRVRQRLWVYGFSRLPENRSISTTGLKRIVEYCASQTPVPFVTYLRERLRMRNPASGEGNFERPTFEFNPLGADLGVDPEAANPEPSSAVLIAVDQTYYVVALGALGRNDLEARDQTLEDLF